MTQDFEHWLNSNKHLIDQDSVGLFEDSLRCYKNDIDRPAYLLAYLGMMVHIRELIKAGKKPEPFPLQKWKDIQTGLNDANSWDKTCIDAIKKQEKKEHGVLVESPVLCIAYDVRTEFEHWQKLRNVCAHYKEYCFVKAHTLTLYAFIVQNLLTISVEGGMMTLLNEFEAFFDPNKTPPNKSWQPLMDKIPTMVRKDQMQEFLSRIRKIITYHTDKLFLFLNVLYHTGTEDIKEAVVGYINSDKDLRNAYITEYPMSIVTLLKPDETYEFSKRSVPYMRNSMAVFAHMIAARMIEKENIPMLAANLIDIVYEHSCYFDLKPEEVTALEGAGVFSLIMQRYLNAGYMEHHCQKVNYSMPFWTSIFRHMPIDKEFVKAVCDIFNQSYKPFALENFIVDNYLEDTEKHKNFFKIAEEEGYAIPASFNSKQNENP